MNVTVNQTNDTRLLRGIEVIVIVGAGWTGRQIAGQMLTHGIQVILCDESTGALNTSKSWILSNLKSFAQEGYWPSTSEATVESRLQLVHPDVVFSPQVLVRNEKAITEAHQAIDLSVGGFDKSLVDLVLECIPEQVALKRRVLKRASELYPETTVIASNSSYFVPSTFSKHLVAPERYAHFHFHVPVWKATVVDVASGPVTSEETLQRLEKLAHCIGQTPIVQRRENSGYVFNAMLKSVLQSALQLFAQGVSTPDQIDLAWTKATGMPVGPFGMMDQIGLDILYQTMSNARFVDGDDVWLPLIAVLQPYIDTGNLGVKTGQGFFKY